VETAKAHSEGVYRKGKGYRSPKEEGEGLSKNCMCCTRFQAAPSKNKAKRLGGKKEGGGENGFSKGGKSKNEKRAKDGAKITPCAAPSAVFGMELLRKRRGRDLAGNQT